MQISQTEIRAFSLTGQVGFQVWSSFELMRVIVEAIRTTMLNYTKHYTMRGKHTQSAGNTELLY